jgi:hypothetical protein
MQNWTDSIIHWNQLPGTEVTRLLDTWGKTPAEIAKYDKKHGYVNSEPKVTVPAKAYVSNTDSPVDFPKTASKKAGSKALTATPGARQKHTGADGAIKFVAHRNLYVGFMGGKVVVTKRTVEACQKVLIEQFGIQGVKVDA